MPRAPESEGWVDFSKEDYGLFLIEDGGAWEVEREDRN